MEEQKSQRLKRLGMGGGAAVAFTVVCAIVVNRRVASSTSSLIFPAAEVPAKPVAVVFGARVKRDGKLSSVLTDRVLTAVELYKSGKVRKLLLTGDNSRKDYDEPTAMRNLAIERGVPATDIVLDYAGFRTYDSCYRAKAVFGVKSAILITQRYHLPRALYTASALGLDVVGCIADRHRYGAQRWFSFREQWSTLVAWVQVNITKPQPHFLGSKITSLAAQ